MSTAIISLLVMLVVRQDSIHCQPTDTYFRDQDETGVARTAQWLRQQLSEQLETIESMKDKIAKHEDSLAKYEDSVAKYDEMFRRTIQDCADVLRQGHATSGVYTIYLSRAKKFIPVYCDMETDGGGWLVFQRRQDGSVNFIRDWNTYKRGFGNISGEFWLGNDYLRDLTFNKRYELRVDLEDFENEKRYVVYSKVEVESERFKYRLTLGLYDGSAGDGGLRECDGQAFSTHDRDNDSHGEDHCSSLFKGGWWYGRCHSANLNGLYLRGHHTSYADGIEWYPWHGHHYSLKKVTMKLRP